MGVAGLVVAGLAIFPAGAATLGCGFETAVDSVLIGAGFGTEVSDTGTAGVFTALEANGDGLAAIEAEPVAGGVGVNGLGRDSTGR